MRIPEACPNCRHGKWKGDPCNYCRPRGTPPVKPQPKPPQKSVHRQLVEYWHDTTVKTRGFKPRISPKDAKQLKNVLELGILDQTELEKVMLYFLADPSYRNHGPSIATLMSSTVLNSLINKMKNRVQFYKELEGYASQYFSNSRKVLISGQKVDIAAHLEQLRRKLVTNFSM